MVAFDSRVNHSLLSIHECLHKTLCCCYLKAKQCKIVFLTFMKTQGNYEACLAPKLTVIDVTKIWTHLLCSTFECYSSFCFAILLTMDLHDRHSNMKPTSIQRYRSVPKYKYFNSPLQHSQTEIAHE